MRAAMTLRRRLIFSVVPRLFACGAIAAACLGAGAALPGDSGAGVAASGAGGGAAASSTSCLRIRPPTPEPLTEAKSMPASAASLRTSGVA